MQDSLDRLLGAMGKILGHFDIVFSDVFPKIKAFSFTLFPLRKAKMQVYLQGWLATGKEKYAHGAVTDISLFCSP